jgi:hypothetical protein
MSRVDIPEKERKDFILYVDEFQNFATASFANILSEARKYHLSLIIAHQYVAQMEEEVSDAVFGNVGTIVAFRVGAEDAELLEKELAPEFLATDIVNLGKRQIYLKLMIDGVASKAFSASTMDTPARLPVSNRDKIIESSRRLYAAPVAEVEKTIATWSATNFQKPSGGSEGAPYRPPVGAFPASGGGPRQDRRPNFDPVRRAPPPSVQAPRPASTPVSLQEALRHGPIDFKGQKVEQKPKALAPALAPANQNSSPRPAVKLDDLREVLRGALKKDE